MGWKRKEDDSTMGFVTLGWFGVVLLSLTMYAVVPAAGAEIEKGKKVFEDKRCAMCHTIGGKGGKTGPDLSDSGNKRDVEWMTKFLKDPKGTVSGTKHMAVKATDEELADLVEYLRSLKK